MTDALFKNFGSVLRHFSAPVIGLGVVHLLNPSDTVLASLVTIAKTGTPPEPVISLWPLVIFMLAFGVILYHGHRTIFHLAFNRLDVWIIRRLRSTKVSARELDLARADRRYAPEGKAERARQRTLDDFNAACHFLWCSAWSIWIIPILLSYKFPSVSWSNNWSSYGPILGVLALIALISDVLAIIWDYDAYERYPAYRGQANRP